MKGRGISFHWLQDLDMEIQYVSMTSMLVLTSGEMLLRNKINLIIIYCMCTFFLNNMSLDLFFTNNTHCL